MPTWTRGAATLAAAVLLTFVPSTALASPPTFAPANGYHKHVCAKVTGHVARCNADVVTDAAGNPLTTTTPVSGYWPGDLQSAYALAGAAATAGAGQTVAIVDAYDAPNAEADLGVYRSNFGLPPCTTDNGCFKKVNQSGGATPPAANGGWAQEISLDLDMVSAICPNCHILLVEANSASYSDLATAVDRAVAMGATQISNSYGGSETFSGSYESHYNHAGVAITASSGDSGYGVEFPASSPHVTAVGGTSLSPASNTRGWSETAWSGAGSGCSSVFSKPAWQTDTGCSRRAVADVSAVANPNTGVAVYDSYAYQGAAGWMVFGGTSVASPIVAAVNALTGGGSAGMAYGAFPYTHASDFFDVMSGSNGSCGGTYLCAAGVGYDGPTGIGTPNVAAVGGTTPPPTAPTNTGAPAISGSAKDFQTLTASTGTWDGSPTSYGYQWQRCTPTCADITGATGSTYTVTDTDVGNTLRVAVIATNVGGVVDLLGPPREAPAEGAGSEPPD